MDVEKRDPKTSGFDRSHRHCVGDVVILEIEKDSAAARNNLPNYLGTGGSKELHADLEHADEITKRFEKPNRLISIVNIQGNNQFVFYIDSTAGSDLDRAVAGASGAAKVGIADRGPDICDRVNSAGSSLHAQAIDLRDDQTGSCVQSNRRGVPIERYTINK